ncbi:hypothetical protein [Ligilactobacillus cholophilus]|uniref:hypothetical protein n=1 Tax=Ligilactobacillus cholophilus TaxID=3050131 RepID=UPI0025B082D3|nr:hypothetical protein [Ligilactobacillus cholophilus]
MLFGDDILNGQQLINELGISRTYLCKLLKLGLPYHQLDKNTRKYYVLDEVKEWLLNN